MRSVEVDEIREEAGEGNKHKRVGRWTEADVSTGLCDTQLRRMGRLTVEAGFIYTVLSREDNVVKWHNEVVTSDYNRPSLFVYCPLSQDRCLLVGQASTIV